MMDSGNGTGMIMPVAPTGNFSGGFGNGFGGDGGWWILLLFILLGGWNNNNGYGAGANGFGGGGLYPWMNQSQQINDGFRDQMINGNITGIQNAVTSGFGDVQTALCSGFAGVNAGIANAAAQAQRENVGLQNQLNMAALRESQTAQNAFIQQGFANEVDQLYNRLNSCPVPTTPVYGRTPIFTCNQNPNVNVGCGCGNFA